MAKKRDSCEFRLVPARRPSRDPPVLKVPTLLVVHKEQWDTYKDGKWISSKGKISKRH